MKRVLTAVVLIPLVLLIVLRAPLWLFALAVGVVIALALYEYFQIAAAAGIKPFRRLTYTLALLPIFVQPLIHSLAPPRRYAAYYPTITLSSGLSILPFVAPLILGIALVFRKDLQAGLASCAASFFGVFYIGSSLSLLIALRVNPFQSVLILLIFFSVWAGDIAAYYVGRSIGKHKLAPVVSPNKSWEGAVASVMASVGVAVLVVHFAPQLSKLFANTVNSFPGWEDFRPRGQTVFIASGRVLFSVTDATLHAIVLGIVTNIAAQFGDLFESALKRGVSIKDSGTLLPGHGGILDRIDALLFAIPAACYYSQLTGFMQSPYWLFYK